MLVNFVISVTPVVCTIFNFIYLFFTIIIEIVTQER